MGYLRNRSDSSKGSVGMNSEPHNYASETSENDFRDRLITNINFVEPNQEGKSTRW